MTEDISKRTILVFLILTIFVSILSTWTLIENVSHVGDTQKVQVSNRDKVSGHVSLEVQEKPQPAVAKGVVSLSVQ